MIKAVIFDLGNVLIHYDARRAASRFSKKSGIPFEKIWKHFFTSKVEKAYTRGEISTREFFNHARRALNSKIDFPTFCRFWNEIFWENRGIRPVLRGLSRHYPLYLISNTNALHFDYVRKKFPHVFRYFTRTFPSHEVGRRKPDPRIFWKVLRATRLRPGDVVFIDDMECFVAAARKVGMKGIRFRSTGALKRELKRLKVRF